MTAASLALNDSQHWCDWFNDMSSHQTTVPLVFSDLLTQTVQLQLVDLQVRPDDKNTNQYFILRLKSGVFSDIPPGTHPLDSMQTVAEMCLLTVSLCVRRHTLHPAARAGGF